jgi:hypothetical protein
VEHPGAAQVPITIGHVSQAMHWANVAWLTDQASELHQISLREPEGSLAEVGRNGN